MKDHGAVTVQLAAMEQENRNLATTVESLKAQVEALKNMIPRQPEIVQVEREPEISAAELLGDDQVIEEPKRRGRPPKVQEAVI